MRSPDRMEEEAERDPEEGLFKKLADAIGESLEQVRGMSEIERRQLIDVLGLETKEGATGPTSSSSAKTHVATDLLLHDVQNRQEGDRSEGKYEVQTLEDVSNNAKHVPNTEKDCGAINVGEDLEGISPLEKRLKEDTEKVKKLLSGTVNETIDMDVLEAYLQAHQENPYRVRVVLEELAGVVDLADLESEDSIIVVDDEVPTAVKGKGKGKGKSCLTKRGALPLESEEIVRQAKHRKLEEGEQNELVNMSNNQGNVDINISGLKAADNRQSTNPPKDSANLEHLIQNEKLLVDDEENSNLINQVPGPSGKRIDEEKTSLPFSKSRSLLRTLRGRQKILN